MPSTCKNCGKGFEITAEDLKFYDKISPIFAGKKYQVPSPTLCPDCRLQRRLAFRNEHNLYARKCDLTGKDIISIYAPESKCKVYGQESWLSDEWDPLKYGRDFDFSRPFFEQFKELFFEVPHPGAGYRSNAENCEYTIYQNDSKNCYMTASSGFMEDCTYTSRSYYAKNSHDILGSNNIELCHELVDCKKMYGCTNCQDCSNLVESSFCYDCHSSQNCYGCVGLRQKKFCFLNEQLTEKEYTEKVKNITIRDFLQKFETLKLQLPRRPSFELNSDDCSGNHLMNCKNVKNSFNTDDSRDCKFQYDIIRNKDSYDAAKSGISELSYETIGGGFYYAISFCIAGSSLSESNYTAFCFNSKNLFGCVSLKRREYCILNKQYTKEEYEKLVPQIIEHMKKTGEYGEFFPMSLSPFAYNETLAYEIAPLAVEEVKKQGLNWKEKDLRNYQPQTYSTPPDIKNVPDSITKEILACAQCGKNYRVILQELNFYRKMKLSVPKKCPDCRHKARMSLRNPRKLYSRTCMKCAAPIQTTYAPDRAEIVYCEKCYLEEVY